MLYFIKTKQRLHQIIAHHEWHISFHIGLVVVLH